MPPQQYIPKNWQALNEPAKPTPTPVTPQPATNETVRNFYSSSRDKKADAIVARMVQHSITQQQDEDWTFKYLDKFITGNKEMLEVKALTRKYAPLEHTILITGETGTGKEIIARSLHGKCKGEFIPINCGGFPEHLIESELFGHLKGSFTGANDDKVGVFQAAQDGTVFLDEIAELPLLMQTKLLRVLQEHEIRRVGSTRTESVNCRVICATHQNLQVSDKFREDLWWRISTLQLHLSPLRDRKDDIKLYLQKHEPAFAEMAKFYAGEFRGNYRELQQMIIREKVSKL